MEVAMQTGQQWYVLEAGMVADQLQVDIATGLSSADAQQRLLHSGPNQLAEKKPRPVWLKFLDQFNSLLILILVGAAVLAGAVGDIKDTVVIAIVVLINAVLGFVQEYRAEAALAALKEMLAPVVRVRRDALVGMVETASLVPGDVLLLEAGDRVPADARVVEAHGAEVAEAALTGESHPVAKTALPVAADAVMAERTCMLYMNTVVTRGRLVAVVVATGMATEMGRLAGMLASASESSTPLQVQLDHLGKRLAAIAGFAVGLFFLIGLVRGDNVITTAMTAIALAVAAIPEGLPAVVTVTLALGMRRMANSNAIVKKLAAVETLGCTTVICSDKTGTLTLNQMTVSRVHFAGHSFTVDAAVADVQLLLPLVHPAVLCADARIRDGQVIGDPTEGALLLLAAKIGVDAEQLAARHPRIAEIPFDSANKFMATFHHDGEYVQMWVKGAPDVLQKRSVNWQGDAGMQPLDAATRQQFEAENTAMAEDALRVLAVAGRRIPAGMFDPAGDLLQWASELTLVGLVGIIDPPRPEAKAAIAVCRDAGIAVKMITGDHRTTAAAIASELGLVGEVHEGRELDDLSQTEIAALVARSSVFARVAPEHKMRIVEALQAEGHVVAMTGDGVNDAPALKAANIGVAMGITGTEVAKEAAALVLTDDNFASIVGAVKEGRTIYDNIVKFVRFQLSTNIGAMLTLLCAPLFGLATPFTAIQILWINIIMDGPPAMSLGVEPARPDSMQLPPRSRDVAILTGKRLSVLVMFGVLMAAGTLAAYSLGLSHGDHRYAVTLTFTTFVLFQFFNIFNARAERSSAFNRQLFCNEKLWLAIVSMVLLQMVVVYWEPAQTIFDTVDLRPLDWVWSVAIASSILFVEEIRKLFFRRFMK
jgi:Ca2+-transporting ATPase